MADGSATRGRGSTTCYQRGRSRFFALLSSPLEHIPPSHDSELPGRHKLLHRARPVARRHIHLYQDQPLISRADCLGLAHAVSPYPPTQSGPQLALALEVSAGAQAADNGADDTPESRENKSSDSHDQSPCLLRLQVLQAGRQPSVYRAICITPLSYPSGQLADPAKGYLPRRRPRALRLAAADRAGLGGMR